MAGVATYMLTADEEFEDAATGHGFEFVHDWRGGHASIRFPRPEGASFIEVWSRRNLLAVNRTRAGGRYFRHHPYVRNANVTPNRCCPHDSFWHVPGCTIRHPFLCTECFSEGKGDDAYHRYGDFSDYLALAVLLPARGEVAGSVR